MRSNELHWWHVLGVIGIVAVFAAIIYAAVVDERAKQACIDNGGRIHEYDCRTTCTTNNGSTTCREHCKWQCVDVPAERRP